jgi:hypothetical protein
MNIIMKSTLEHEENYYILFSDFLQVLYPDASCAVSVFKYQRLRLQLQRKDK